MTMNPDGGGEAAGGEGDVAGRQEGRDGRILRDATTPPLLLRQ